MNYSIETPLTIEKAKKLKAGDIVILAVLFILQGMLLTKK